MITMVCGILTDYFRIEVPAVAGLILRGNGLLMIVAGSILAIRAVRSIGKDMQTDIAVNKGHVLKTEGAYAVVRHPMYLSLILLALGAGLSTLNLLLAGFALFALANSQNPKKKKTFKRYL
jgi:protein-S-isoprenylcysteine O-methyltransferase Ste14